MASAESPEQAQRWAERKLAVDEAYQTLEEYNIRRRRITFLADGERRKGGFGTVRKAHLRTSSSLSTWLGLSGQPQVVAVKEIKIPNNHDTSDLKRLFTREVLVWSRLKRHPGIAKFLGFCTELDRKEAWLISAWEPHGNVSDFIKGRNLEVPEKLSLAYDTIDALAFLHQMDPPVCHGDIKSPNVLVNLECRAVLCDFGLARLYEDSGFTNLESTAGLNKGSIRWCSPELLTGQPRTVKSDIYAWAWLVWEIMTGEVPYAETKADYAIMLKIFQSSRPQVDGESRLSECLQLWDLMARCWLTEPLQRPTSAMCKTTFEYLPHCPPTPDSADPHNRPAALLESLGDLESWKGNHKEGFAYLEQALRRYKKEGNDRGVASVLRKQAAVAYRDSNLAKVLTAASAALKKCRSLRDDIGVADSLYWAAFAEPDIVDAIRNLQESLAIFSEKAHNVGVAKCLQGLGELYRREGRTADAVSTLEQAVAVASGCGDRLGEANALIALGVTNKHLDRVEQAILAFEKAREIARNTGWAPGLSTCLCRLGTVKLQQGIHEEAEELLRESVSVARSNDAGWRLGQALYWLGRCLREQNWHEQAVLALEESCSVYRNLALDVDPRWAETAALLADSKSALNRKGEALDWYDQAITEWHKCGNEAEISRCVSAKAAILKEMDRNRDVPSPARHG